METEITIASTKWKIFNGTDFFAWEEDTKAKLQSIKLWRLVIGKEQKPAEDASIENYEERSEQAFGILKLILSPACRDCLRGMEVDDPVLAWQLIQRAFKRESPDTVAVVLEQLIDIKCQEEKDIPDYLSSFNILTNRISGFKIKIPVTLLNVILFKGLPNGYDQFCQVIKMGDPKELKENMELIRNEHQVRMLQSGELKYKEEVMFTRGSCSGCGRNHNPNDCWTLHPEKAPEWMKEKERRRANQRRQRSYITQADEHGDTVL